MEVTLKPDIKLQPRYWTLGAIIVLIFLVPHVWWWVKALACIFPVALTGTYRISTVSGDKFQTQPYVAYLPLKPQKCNLPGVIYVETKYNATGVGAYLMHYIGFIFDMLIPAFGGAYEIWLVTAKGREIVAWQGFDQNLFEENLALLMSRSGAELRGRSR